MKKAGTLQEFRPLFQAKIESDRWWSGSARGSRGRDVFDRGRGSGGSRSALGAGAGSATGLRSTAGLRLAAGGRGTAGLGGAAGLNRAAGLNAATLGLLDLAALLTGKRGVGHHDEHGHSGQQPHELLHLVLH